MFYRSIIKKMSVLSVICMSLLSINKVMAKEQIEPTAVLATNGSAGTLTISYCMNNLNMIDLNGKKTIDESNWVALPNLSSGYVLCIFSDKQGSDYSLSLTNINGILSNLNCTTLSGEGEVKCVLQFGTGDSYLAAISKG